MFHCHMTNWYHLVSSIGSIIVSHISRKLIHRYLSIHSSIHLYPIYPIGSRWSRELRPQPPPGRPAARFSRSLRPYCAKAPFSANWTSTAWELHIEGAGAGKFSTAMGGPRHGLISACKIRDFTIFQPKNGDLSRQISDLRWNWCK